MNIFSSSISHVQSYKRKANWSFHFQNIFLFIDIGNFQRRIMAASNSKKDFEGIDTVRQWLKNSKVVDVKLVSKHFKVIISIEMQRVKFREN